MYNVSVYVDILKSKYFMFLLCLYVVVLLNVIKDEF